MPRRGRALSARKSMDDPRHFVHLLGSQPFELRDDFLDRHHTFTLRQAAAKIHLVESHASNFLKAGASHAVRPPTRARSTVPCIYAETPTHSQVMRSRVN